MPVFCRTEPFNFLFESFGIFQFFFAILVFPGSFISVTEEKIQLRGIVDTYIQKAHNWNHDSRCTEQTFDFITPPCRYVLPTSILWIWLDIFVGSHMLLKVRPDPPGFARSWSGGYLGKKVFSFIPRIRMTDFCLGPDSHQNNADPKHWTIPIHGCCEGATKRGVQRGRGTNGL